MTDAIIKRRPGRPKGGGGKIFKSWTALLRELADREDEKGVKRQRKIIHKLLRLAEEGEQWAIKEVLDRCEGKAIQQIHTDVTTGGESLNASISFVGAPVVDALQPGALASLESSENLNPEPALPLATEQSS